MPADFTYGMYATLLDTCRAVGLPLVTVREYLDDDGLPPNFVVLRHDVDRKPGNALDFARLESERGISSTYYFRTVAKTFDPDRIRAVEALGHEIGYHYEDVDRAAGDLEAAHASFGRNLGRLREVARVDTVCMHGNPLTPHDNRALWTDGPGFDAYDLVGEAYLSMDFTDVWYYSDTGRTWRDGALKVKDHPVGGDGKGVQVGSTPELIELLRSTPDRRYCLLSHPDRWTDTPLQRATETAFDALKNAAKQTLHAVSRRR